VKVLYITSESYPFLTSGGLGDVSFALPKALAEKSVDVRVVMPLYADISEQYRSKMRYVVNFNVPLAWRNQYCGLFELEQDGVKFYFLDNEYYFKRSGLYGYYDDGERFAFFAKACIEMLNNISFHPDVIHANDWQSALAPVFLNEFYRDNPKFYSIKTLLTIHNIQYQGIYGREVMTDILGIHPAHGSLLEYGGNINYLKAGIASVDRVNTVSPRYAEELKEPYFACGLDGLMRDNAFKLCGILNGIDRGVYDPSTDSALDASFDSSDFSGKAKCKKSLAAEFGLTDTDKPIIGLVSRLVSHKGFDLVKNALEYILASGMNVVLLGSGDYEYESAFSALAERHQGSLGVRIGFDGQLARRIYAGSDLFLMPSLSEPCGLAQMIALRYGTLPIVHRVGGLYDSVTDCGDGEGNGFTFVDVTADELLGACIRAKNAFYSGEWQTLVKRALDCNFSWDRSADRYLQLYEEIQKLWE